MKAKWLEGYLLKKENRFYVYEWYNIENGYVFYVGKGTSNRCRQTSEDRRNSDFVDYYNSNNCDYRFVEKDLTEEEAYKLENAKIIEYHNIGQAHCNHDEGGRCGATNYGSYNGMYGRTHTDEVKKILHDINVIAMHRGSNAMAKDVFVYSESTNELIGKYDCVPDAVDELYPLLNDEVSIRRKRNQIYWSMKNNYSRDGMIFSREAI